MELRERLGDPPSLFLSVSGATETNQKLKPPSHSMLRNEPNH